MQYVLLAYQVRYMTPSSSRDGKSSSPHIIQSDRTERVVIHQEAPGPGHGAHPVPMSEDRAAAAAAAGGRGGGGEMEEEKEEEEEDYEEQVQELVDILMVDRDTARSALVVNHGECVIQYSA